MFFNSFHFVVFFAAVLACAAVVRKAVRVRNAFLLVASYYFYACWDWRFLGLIVVSTLVDYACGRAMNVGHVEPDSAPPRTRRRKLILLASLVTNLGILGFFKYCGFFVDSAAEGLAAMGVQANVSTLQIILPVGISFYTFQTLSYTIDVYRGRVETERSLLNFALFVAFFPQLVAGPIERASRLLPQIRRPSHITWEKLNTGFYLICWGLFKKVVLADNLARTVDTLFELQAPTGLQTLIAVYAFALQIYCDFSGYSDIARGAARCMGFDIMKNFRLPYFAANPREFWQRWHISLSTWLRDYLYIPLGGNRKGSGRTYVNLMITMLLGGLWHGAGWTYVLWGFYHGLLLCAHRAAEPVLARLPKARSAAMVAVGRGVRVVGFFHLVCLGWLIFRADSVAQAGSMLGGAVRNFALTLDDAKGHLQILLPAAALLVTIQWFQRNSDEECTLLRIPAPVRAFVYAGLILAFILFGVADGEAFIYFRF